VGCGLYNVPWTHEVVYISLIPKQVTADNKCMCRKNGHGVIFVIMVWCVWRVMSDKTQCVLVPLPKFKVRSGKVHIQFMMSAGHYSFKTGCSSRKHPLTSTEMCTRSCPFKSSVGIINLINLY